MSHKQNKNSGHIYLLTCSNGKKYVGQAVCVLSNNRNYGFTQRWKGHILEAKNNKGYCRVLDNAIRKYGKDSFKVELIEEILLEQLNEREEYWILKLNTLSPNGYNLKTGASKNSRSSDETKEKQRQSMIGKNKGNILPRVERKREEDSTLPKYLRSYQDVSGKNGYRISNHPILKDKSFVSKKLSSEEKLNLALEYLNSNNEMKVQRLDGSGSEQIVQA